MSDAKLVKLNTAVETLNTKLAAAVAARDAYVANAAARAAALNIPEGTQGTFVFGRAETAKTLSGKVIAVIDNGNGNLLKVLAGEGKDLRVYDVASNKFTPDEPVQGTADPIVGGDQSLAAAIVAADDLGVVLEPDLSNHTADVVTGTELTEADAAVNALV